MENNNIQARAPIRLLHHKPPAALRPRPLAVAVALALATAPAGAATIVVPDDCLLPEAIMAANLNEAVGGCPPGDDQDNGGDIIELTADITLSAVDNDTDGDNGLPSVRSIITINGHDHTLARASAEETPEFRLLHVAAEGHLTLNKVTLRNGFDRSKKYTNSGFTYVGGGGALYNRGRATFTHSAVSDNNSVHFGGGLTNAGTLLLTDSTVSGNRSDLGGGLANSGTLFLNRSNVSDNFDLFDYSSGGGLLNRGSGTAHLMDSTVSGNDADWGGGLFNSGLALLTRSTVSDNGGYYSGGGLHNSFFGTARLTNSTISGNRSDVSIEPPRGGGLYNRGTLTLTHNTISENVADMNFYDPDGGGLFNGGTLTLTNSLIANNEGGDCDGTATFQGLNFIADGSCAALESDQLSGDPRLEPLADNGGPTQTHALLADSPARDRIPFLAEVGCEPSEVTADQRGISRPQPTGGECDIGAFERLDPPPLSIKVILDFFEEAVAAGELQGVAPGRSALNRLNALRRQLETVRDLEEQEAPETAACGPLAAMRKRLHTDADTPPHPDHFVTGPAAAELAVMIEALHTERACR